MKRVIKFDTERPNHPLIVDASSLDAVFEEIKAALEYGEPGDLYTIEVAEMAPEELEALPEWDGF